MGGVWEFLEMWGKEAMGCCQQSLMGDFGGS
jgi:hypothetical protein